MAQKSQNGLRLCAGLDRSCWHRRLYRWADVTGVCSTRNVDLVRSLGADHVIDYTQEDFTRNARRYDLVFDLVGNRSLTEFRRALTPAGKLVLSGGLARRPHHPKGLRLLQDLRSQLLHPPAPGRWSITLSQLLHSIIIIIIIIIMEPAPRAVYNARGTLPDDSL
jgi:hypothetical protein